jgi:hypothetical protein
LSNQVKQGLHFGNDTSMMKVSLASAHTTGLSIIRIIGPKIHGAVPATTQI